MEVALLFVLILINGVLAMTEVAVIASRKARLRRAADQGDAMSRTALSVAEHPTRSLSTIQIGITSIGILNGIVGEAIFARPLAEWATGLGLAPGPSYVLATAIVVVFITYVSIVFGELVPKRIGQLVPERLLRILARPLLIMAAISGPFVKLLTISTDLLLKLLGAKRSADRLVTEEEIEVMLAEGSEAGIIEDDEKRIVRNVFRLDSQSLASIMIPRSEFVALDLTRSDTENLRVLETSDHERHPVHHGSPDQIVGVASARRLFLRMRLTGEFDIKSAMDPPGFVPSTLTAMDLLEQFRKTKTQMAFIVDEYGGVQGLVTLHDLLEQIAGEFPTASAEESRAVQRADGSWLLDGMLPITELQERFEWPSLPEDALERYHTLGGMIFALLGRIPQTGEAAEWEGWKLEVVDMDGNRIDKVLAAPPAAKPLRSEAPLRQR